VSALGHYLEEEGIATVAISLIRPQTENTKPPRALWVSFELGRPFGPPRDPAFQRRVVHTALRLLERGDGPVLIEDFPDDDPRAAPDPEWRPPPLAAGPQTLDQEIEALLPARERWLTRRGRTTIGLSGIGMPQVAHYIEAWLQGPPPASPREGYSAILALRFAVDDLKAYYLEAAAAEGSPSSRQLGDWFWQETAAGKAIVALRALGLDSGDDRLKAVLGNFMVPAARVAMLGLSPA
jgi:hypothetical protein